ncbi:MAG: universal stress protein [Deltaproteobacteria bacterium]|nr:universal stress protein [Deltaproteobacteria bacterium]
MYKNIYVPVDNSDLSNAAVDLALKVGGMNKSRLTGSHVYAAKLHDKRFKTMESGLPAQFHEESRLERQRKIHDSLITKGLELITDSYLGVMAKSCAKIGLQFEGVSLEGKNWQELVRDIEENNYDLVVMGAHGLGRVPGAILGSVADRVTRRVKRDVLIVKENSEYQSDTIVVCLDGSERSYGALKVALDLANKFNKKVKAVSAFDPYYHYVMFDSLKEVLTEKAKEVFKFEEQEKLHEDIIDSGLAKVYQGNLDIAGRIADDNGHKIETTLLDGKAWQKVLEYVNKDRPWLLILGRTGIHNDDDIDLGSNAENILRMAPCNILLTETKFEPPLEYQADETIMWTKEAKAKMETVPAMAKGVAMKAIQQHAVAEGYTMITAGVVDNAVRKLLPPEAIRVMGINFDDGPQEETMEEYKTFSLSFECPACKYVHHEVRPKVCPVCAKGGETFKIIEASRDDGTGDEGSIAGETFDGRKLNWTAEAHCLLQEIGNEAEKKQIRLKLEKQAHVRHLSVISKEMVLEARGEDSVEPGDNLQWTECALKRLARVPEGFMRDAARKSVEGYAGLKGIKNVDQEVVEAGLVEAREKMQAQMSGHMDR